MTTITINDELIQKVIDLTQTQNAQQAVVKILSEYLQQHQTPHFLRETKTQAEQLNYELSA